MRFPILVLACVLAATATPSLAQTTPGAGPLTLAEAMRMAETAHPSVRLREAQRAAAEGARRESGALLFNNPELGADRTRRRSADAQMRTNEWSAGLSQRFELGGQQSRRREASAATLVATEAEVEHSRRQARADAALRYFAVLAAQRRVEIEQRSAEMFQTSASAVDRRRAAGEDTRLDANVALIEAERARNALASAREQLLDARTELAAAVQLPPAELPEVESPPAAVEAIPYTQAQLLVAAESLPRQRALVAREDAARARLALENAKRYPDLTVGLRQGREGLVDERERVTTLSLSLPLPIFNRNDAGIGQAATELAQAEIESASARRETQAQVRRLWARLQSQRERVERLQASLLPAAGDNRRLAMASRQAGQIGVLDQLIIQRQALDAERELNDALADLRATRIELENAAGWSQEGSSQ